MLVCGINGGHNASAALVQDGRLIGALQEERLTRCKNQSGYPRNAVERLLRHHSVSWSDVDAFVFGGHEVYYEPGLDERDYSLRIRSYKNLARTKVRRWLRKTPMRARTHRARRERQIANLLEHGVKRDVIFQIDHHRSHAATAYYGAGMSDDTLVITIDGAGDGLCATVSEPAANGQLKTLATVSEEHSIGNLWSVITALLTMVPLEHEYKLMGMAPYASAKGTEAAKQIFSRAFEHSNGTWRLANKAPNILFSYEYWREALEFTRFDQLCGGLQAFTEEFLGAWVQQWLRRTGKRKLRLSGGVFMNVKLNQVLGALPEVDDIFITPSCGDETNSIGAAWAYLADQGRAEEIEPFGPLYLGPEPAASDYEAAALQAKEQGFSVERPDRIEDFIADLLAGGEVVARVTGGEEFGARALGNRSLLADPSSVEVVKVINHAIKCRDFWMPFAPSVLEEAADRYLHNPKGFYAPYMILTFDSRNTSEIAAACHPADATIRPQMVRREWNPGYHRVLESFQERTGRGALLNTSFNIHGEPIASSPADAVDVLRRSGLRHLALGPFLISKDSAGVSDSDNAWSAARLSSVSSR